MYRSVLAVIVLFAAQCAFGQSTVPKCSAPEYHQLDFWIGNWDVFEVDGTVPVAHAKIDRILNGCAIHEQYDQADGLRGESFSSYDAGRKQWRQSWYTNRGTSFEMLGELRSDSLILTAIDYNKSPQSRVRSTWKPLAGSVEESAVTSDDEGKTWKPYFDLIFRPSHTSDEKAVLQLDTEYQAAVKKNDAATMDRLLDEHFVLQSSSGKTFSKSDLLAEARGNHVVYETQDDSDQVVHIFGDTAVLTAKLHAKGTENGKPFDHSLCFSDTYARTSTGWRYVFGQASCRSPQP